MKNPFKALRENVKSDAIEVTSASGKSVGLALLDAAAEWWDENNEKYAMKLVADGEAEIDIKIKVKLPPFSVKVEDVP